ncbi:uncharacterized protein DFL_000423 [Arthrobotrys flagrans]|uniref:Uncharacterized protein n=1 Tax=Arthrobotrys flagrans TaxID=97331 RepID=A0A437ADQ7_ARTFL|nr:hypothetical protein DFL_000423 [Arthrobotrys flagrans]
MCYQFVLYTGCGHDRSLLYFRARSYTKECLCRAFSRLPLRAAVCPECDRALRIARGQPVPQDHLTKENRAKCQAWRAIVDNGVKDAENKKLIREAQEAGKDPSTVTIGREVHVSARHLKYAGARKQKHQNRIRNGKNPTGFAPPYVPQPGETFLDHIICEIIDDAKSGGEMGRLETALETGLQGYGWIGPAGEESWLKLSDEWMKGDGANMDINTGTMGPGFLSPTDFPALPPPPGTANAACDAISEKPASPPGKPASTTETLATTTTAKVTASKLKYDPSKTFVPSVPIPEITFTPSPDTTAAKSSLAPTTGLLTELPPLAILPLLFEKYEEDGEEVITDGSRTGSSFPTTQSAVEQKEDPYPSSAGELSNTGSHPTSQPPSQPLPATSHSPAISVQSKAPTPVPEGPYLQVPQPLPRTIVFHPAQPGFIPPVAVRQYNPSVQQRTYNQHNQHQHTRQMPMQHRSFTPPMAKLRSHDHIKNNNNNRNNNRHYQSKPHNYRFNNNHKFNGQQFYRHQASAPGPYFARHQKPLVSGPMPYSADPRPYGPVATGHAAGSVGVSPAS